MLGDLEESPSDVGPEEAGDTEGISNSGAPWVIGEAHKASCDVSHTLMVTGDEHKAPTDVGPWPPTSPSDVGSEGTVKDVV